MSGHAVTEAQAETMFCPHYHDTCLGSKCMGWRIATPARPTFEQHIGHRPPDTEGWTAEEFGPIEAVLDYERERREVGEDPTGWTYRWSRITGERPARGYCGLAGAP